MKELLPTRPVIPPFPHCPEVNSPNVTLNRLPAIRPLPPFQLRRINIRTKISLLNHSLLSSTAARTYPPHSQSPRPPSPTMLLLIDKFPKRSNADFTTTYESGAMP
ncbi:uncharacterized protein EI97DRAFT_437940 [Westerdykella ornata]|uniref:Uncharacterized protein n=1 Tax=Westerdykella ornata TaxID=318751 RepID=A0A6A6J451_WESOR|nr:uncharacterized protein EI97DRAFT_437940 [Westerdykella ornata]KAF2271351.1 hypothetical protein EI97DRAFT_437940 [Westerdykella ornata]